MLQKQESEINDLRSKLAIQDTMITDLKVEKIALIDTVNTKQAEITYLSDEVQKGKKLQAHDFVVTAVKKNGKESFDEIYKSAIENQPNIKAAELDIRAAEIGEKIAKSSLYPSVNLGGSLRSNYNNQGQKLEGFRATTSDIPVGIDGIPAVLTFPGQEAIRTDNPYFNQIDENLSYGFGLGVSIPIYNNYQARAGIERAKLNRMRSALNIERRKNTLKTNVQRALADAQAASKSYQAAMKSKEAQVAAYNNSTKQYELGAINSFDFVNARSLLDNAEVSLIIAKYDYLVKAKVVDFYMGRSISLN